MKKINWACIYQELEFDSEAEFQQYISKIIGGYIIKCKESLLDGRVRVIIKKQYNKCKMEGDSNGT